MRVSHLAQLLLAPLVDGVLVHLHDLAEEDLAHLGEAPAGGAHQSVQDGGDVGLDVAFHTLLRLGHHEGCRGTRERGRAFRGIKTPIQYTWRLSLPQKGRKYLLTHKTRTKHSRYLI